MKKFLMATFISSALLLSTSVVNAEPTDKINKLENITQKNEIKSEFHKKKFKHRPPHTVTHIHKTVIVKQAEIDKEKNQPRYMRPHPMKYEQMSPKMKEEMQKRKAEIDKRLKITEKQKKELKIIHENSKSKIAPKIKLLTEAEFELSVLEKREFNKDNFGIATLEEVQLSGKTKEQLKEEIKTLKNEIREIKKANFEASQKVFTEKQKKELEKMRQERKKKKFPPRRF